MLSLLFIILSAFKWVCIALTMLPIVGSFFEIALGDLGRGLIAIDKRWRLKVREQSERSDARAPVVFLRAFDGDSEMSQRRMAGRRFKSKTEEEELAEALQEIGPMVAVGRPGEFLPQLGASRVYINGDGWRDQVRQWFHNAALVVVIVPRNPSAGIAWEISSSLECVKRDRLTFLICNRRIDWYCFGRRFARFLRSVFSTPFLRPHSWGNDGVPNESRDHGVRGILTGRTPLAAPDSLAWLKEIFRKNNIPEVFPDVLRRGPYGSSVAGVVYFDVDGLGQFSPLVKPSIWSRFITASSPLVRMYRLAFAPVISRINGTALEVAQQQNSESNLHHYASTAR